jgi:thioredoxin-like negative regulator of GroEL
MTPEVRRTPDRFSAGVDFAEIDAAANPELTAQYSVRAVPTLVMVDEGAVLGRAVGAQSRLHLTELFEGTAAGTVIRARVGTTDRALRLTVAAALAIIGALASQPLMWLPASAIFAFALWDLVPGRNDG